MVDPRIACSVKITPTTNTGAGEGLLVTRILLYLPRYKKYVFELGCYLKTTDIDVFLNLMSPLPPDVSGDFLIEAT